MKKKAYRRVSGWAFTARTIAHLQSIVLGLVFGSQICWSPESRDRQPRQRNYISEGYRHGTVWEDERVGSVRPELQSPIQKFFADRHGLSRQRDKIIDPQILP